MGRMMILSDDFAITRLPSALVPLTVKITTQSRASASLRLPLSRLATHAMREAFNVEPGVRGAAFTATSDSEKVKSRLFHRPSR